MQRNRSEIAAIFCRFHCWKSLWFDLQSFFYNSVFVISISSYRTMVKLAIMVALMVHLTKYTLILRSVTWRLWIIPYSHYIITLTNLEIELILTDCDFTAKWKVSNRLQSSYRLFYDTSISYFDLWEMLFWKSVWQSH